MAVKLSESFVKSAPPPSKGYKIWYDEHRDAPKGFGLRVTANGARSFILRYKTDAGADTITTIGSYPAWSLTAARIEGSEKRREVEQGGDPIHDARERKAAEANARAEAEREQRIREQYTLAVLCGAYVKHLRDSGKRSSAGNAASAFKVHLLEVPDFAEIAATPARDITPEQIALIVRRVMEAGKNRTAGILRSYLNAAFTAARKAPYNAALPSALIPFGIKSNPVEVIATVPVARGERVLNANELREYLKALGEELPDQALRLALYAGGQRAAQLLRARVRDYDPEHQTLLLWDGKGRRQKPRPHLLPLAQVAANIVQGLVDRAIAKAKDGESSPSLFWSRGKIMHQDTPGGRVSAIASGMKGDPFDLRDIRRTVETMMAGMGIGKDVRAHLLSHGLSGVQTAHYDRYDYLTEKRAALERWEQHLERIVKGHSFTNLVEFRQAG